MKLSRTLSGFFTALAVTMAAWAADAGTVVSQKFQSPTLDGTGSTTSISRCDTQVACDQFS